MHLLHASRSQLQEAPPVGDEGREGEGVGGAGVEVLKDLDQVHCADFQCGPERVRPHCGCAVVAGTPSHVLQPQRETLQVCRGRMQVSLNTTMIHNS